MAAGAPRLCAAVAHSSHTCALAGSLSPSFRPSHLKYVALASRPAPAARQRLRPAGARASAWDGPKPWRPSQSGDGVDSAATEGGWLQRLRLPTAIMPWDSR